VGAHGVVLDRLVAVVAMTLSLAVLPPAAQATFPGKNGKIEFHKITYDPQTHDRLSNEAFAVNPDGSGGAKLADLAFLGWSADGTKFAATVLPSIGLPQEPLFVLNADGTGSQRIDPFQNGISEVSVGWSHDSTRLAFGGKLDRVTTSGIWTVRADGASPRQLTQGFDTNPAWSPDGTMIAFARQSDTSDPAIYVVKSDATGLTKVGDGSNFVYGPQWSPDGRRLAFIRDGRVVSVASDGTDEHLVTTAPFDSAVQWSPDGAKLLVTRSNPDRPKTGIATLDLYVVNANGSSERLIASDVDRGAVWSPDSRHIAFTAQVIGGLSDLWVVGSNGSGRTNLTRSPNSNELSPDWQPLPGPRRSDFKSSNQFCKAEKTFWGDQFRQRYTNFGQCVRRR
jgi:Tol biopolymer transport system component